MGHHRGNRTKFRPWSTEEDERLRAICNIEGGIHGTEGWMRVAEQFEGRSVGGCQQRWIILRDGPKPAHTRKVQPLSSLPIERVSRQEPIDLPPPASITAWICGDPLPGRSALDRQMKGLNQGAAANA